MQGVGLCTLEECLVLSSNGAVFTRGPGNYKIPSFRDVPVKLNVKLLKDKEYKHLKTIKSSKGRLIVIEYAVSLVSKCINDKILIEGVGEPPLFLGTSVFFALRDAVLSAR
jgi:xanthine dehydrogenase/oxidase